MQFTNLWWSFPCSSEVSHLEVIYNVLIHDIPRFVHAFTAAGILPSQYLHFSQFASIGIVGKWYIQQGLYNNIMYKVYNNCLVYTQSRNYIGCVDVCAEISMSDAIEAVKALPDYNQTGEV